MVLKLIYRDYFVEGQLDYFLEGQEVLNESIIKKKELFHGSNLDLPYLAASGIDFGNTFNKPGWSLFCWGVKEHAINWAGFTFFDRLTRDSLNKEFNEYCKDENNEVGYSHIWYWPDDTFLVNKGLALYLLEKCKEKDIPRYIYVYTIDGTKYDVSIGNDSEHAEYTIRSKDKIKYKSKEKFEITESFCSSHGWLADNSVIRQHKNKMNIQASRAKGQFKRGFLSVFMNHDFLYQDRALVKRLYRDIKNGELKPGDDVEKYMKENNLKFDNITLFKRCWNIFRNKFGW